VDQYDRVTFPSFLIEYVIKETDLTFDGSFLGLLNYGELTSLDNSVFSRATGKIILYNIDKYLFIKSRVPNEIVFSLEKNEIESPVFISRK
jgi:hypothetical protein